jgi:type II secretory pathway pseudopilin PulG
MGKLRIKIPASTLIEAIVALIIITIITGMASTFLTQNIKNNNLINKAKTFLILDNEIEKTIKYKEFEDSNQYIDGYLVEKKVTKNNYDGKLINIQFIISDNRGKLIFSRHKVFYNATIE